MANKNISGDVNVEFTEAQSRQSLESGESVKTLFGKLRKWLTDLKPVAFSGSYNDLSNKPTIPSSATITGAVNGTGALSGIPVNRKSCYVGNGGGSTITNSWFLTAQVDVAQNSYVYKATFYVELGIDTTLSNVGILEIVVRKTSGTLQYMKAKWIVGGSGINLNDFALSYDSTSHLCSLYINRPAAYSVYRLTSIAESERGGGGDKADVWTLYNNTSTGIASPPSGTGITTIYSELADTHLSQQVNNNSKLTETSDTTPYLNKSSEHDAVYDELVGGGVAWNQLIGASWDSLNKTEGTTFTQNSDGTIHISGTGSGLHFCNSEIEGGLVNGHKYLYSIAGMKAGITSQIYSTTSGSARYIVTSTTNSDGIFTYTAQASDISQFARFYTDTSYSGTTDLKYILIDLTQMFGTTIADYVYNLEQSTAGSGMAWLKSYGFFTKDYYAYNAGSLVSVNTSGKKVVGKNLLKITLPTQTNYGVTYISDAETGIVTATGTANASGGAQFRIPIPAELAGNYYFSALTSTGSDSTYDAYVWCNTDNARAKKWNGTTNSSSDYGNGNCEIRLEAGKTYTLNLRVKNGVTANNLVFKPMIRRADVTDSTFEPYASLTYPIQSTDLRGLYKLNGNKLYTDGDIYSAEGIVTRKYGIVDLGTLDWSMTTNNRFYANVEQGSAGIITNALCAKYVVTNTTFSNLQDKEMNYGQPVVSNGWRAAAVRDSAYTDATTFKTAMSGVYLIYELATPTTAPAPPFTSPQIVYRSGTEEYLDTRDVPLPVGGNRKYVDIPEWMVNEYFDDVRSSASGAIAGDLVFDESSSSSGHGLISSDNKKAIVFNHNKIELTSSSGNGRGYIADGDEITTVTLRPGDFEVSAHRHNSQAESNSSYLAMYPDGIEISVVSADDGIIVSGLDSGTGVNLVIASDGTIYKASSSRDVKHDIEYIKYTESYHDALMQLKPATFIYNSDKTETPKLGMIAEDVADVCPIAGMTDKDGKVENYDDRAIIAMLVAEVQRLNAEIEKLKGR